MECPSEINFSANQAAPSIELPHSDIGRLVLVPDDTETGHSIGIASEVRPVVSIEEAIPELLYVQQDGVYVPFNARRFRTPNAYKGRGDIDSMTLYMNQVSAGGPVLTRNDERYLSQYVHARHGAWRLFVTPKDARKFEANEQDLTPEILNTNLECSPEQAQLLRMVLKDGTKARDAFVINNLRLVFSHAKNRLPIVDHLELLDLLQEGNLILGHAVDKFDWKKGYKFSTYASNWIRQALDKAIINMDKEIRLPGDPHNLLREIRALRRELPNGKTLSTTEMAGLQDVDVDKVEAVVPHLSSALRLDQPLAEYDGDEIKDIVAAQDDSEMFSDPTPS